VDVRFGSVAAGSLRFNDSIAWGAAYALIAVIQDTGLRIIDAVVGSLNSLNTLAFINVYEKHSGDFRDLMNVRF
jgi:hypothetical protein